MGFTKSKVDSNLYYKVVEDEGPVILLLYVDDLFLIGEEKLIVEYKKKLATEFEMKDLRQMHYSLGLEVWRNPKIFLSQGKYAVETLQRFGMMDCKPMATLMTTNLKLLHDASSEIADATLFQRMIGSLMYLTNTRPDICFAVNTLSQYMTQPRQVHIIATKHVMRYLKGTIEYGLWFSANYEFKLQGFIDSDWDGNVKDRKSK